MSQVLLNLTNNSIAAISEDSKSRQYLNTQDCNGGEIIIKTNLGKENIIINVSDNGPGIAEKDLKHIFDPSYTKKRKIGIGVGLSICHGIIEDHNGTIEAKNLPDGGANFSITLPVN